MSNGNGQRHVPESSIKLNLADCESYQCSECGGIFFFTLFSLKKIPALMSRSGKEELVNLETFFCNECEANTGIIKRG